METATTVQQPLHSVDYYNNLFLRYYNSILVGAMPGETPKHLYNMDEPVVDPVTMEEEEEEKPMDLTVRREDLKWREMEDFVAEVKQHRVARGMTQGDVGAAVGRICDADFSQTTISRFEAMNLSLKNMGKLRPLLQRWLDESTGRSTTPSSSGASSSTADSSLGGIKRRKKRTSFDNNVRIVLEKTFMQNHKPTVEEIAAIADNFGMDREVVRVWFCNRRQKERRSSSVAAAGTSNSHLN